MNTKLIIAVMTLTVLTLSQSAFADQTDRDARRQFRQEQRDTRRAHFGQQHQENREFRKSLEGKTPAEKASAVASHRATQHSENTAHIQEMHDKKMSKLDERLAANTKLTDAQKTDIKNQAESQYQEVKSHREQQFTENQAKLNELASNPNLTREEARTTMKSHLETQHAENKAFREEQKTERKTFWDSIRSTFAPKASN